MPYCAGKRGQKERTRRRGFTEIRRHNWRRQKPGPAGDLITERESPAKSAHPQGNLGTEMKILVGVLAGCFECFGIVKPVQPPFIIDGRGDAILSCCYRVIG